MLQEVIELQQNAVAALVEKLRTRRELTFRAPTGSGKTRMMADLMNRILQEQSNVVFLVSTLSKGGLAGQNYRVFEECANQGIFSMLKPHLISTEVSGEENAHIPTDYNVYVLPRDLYKKNGRLMQGPMDNFLQAMTGSPELFKKCLGKQIYLIKDECHQATNNLDSLAAKYFTRVINCSATPKLSRGQNPDVEITNEEAVNARLIKRVEMGSDEDSVEQALLKLEAIKEQYVNLLGVNPCLIIQISNRDKAEQEWQKIETLLNKTEHQHLKWMSIVDKKEACKTNDKVDTLPVERWKDYAREKASTIDVIVFKMVISEGWDIPRACMLYQVRDSHSRQLDEQVMGRVRRNPRLTDFERLSPEAQELAMKAWVWGIPPEKVQRSYQVSLFGKEDEIPTTVRIKTTRLTLPDERTGFNVGQVLKEVKDPVAHQSIFALHARLQKCSNDVVKKCYEYAGDDVSRWWRYCENLDLIRREYNRTVCDYRQSMSLLTNEEGKTIEVSFPLTSLYTDTEKRVSITNWVWKRMDGDDQFAFDSEAEQKWAKKLKELSEDEDEFATMGTAIVSEPSPHYAGGYGEKEEVHESKYLWGKNFLEKSEIKFEYYLGGLHRSYPDFVLQDCKGRIHLFEVKSVNRSGSTQIDSEDYENKIRALEECYLHCSRLTDHYFYLPVLQDDTWQIKRFASGEQQTLTWRQFERSLED